MAHARHRVIREVRLFDNAVLDRDALENRQAEAVDDAALDLGDHVVRLNLDSAIRRTPEVMHRDLTGAAIERNFSDASSETANHVDEGKAERAAFLATPAPIRHRRNRLDDLSPTGRIPQQLEPELHGIDPTFLGDLVQKGFGYEGAGGEADASERRGAYSRIAIEQLSPLIGNVIAVKLHAGHQDEVFAAAQFVKTHIRKRRHAVTSQPMVPCDQLAAGVQPGADMRRGD